MSKFTQKLAHAYHTVNCCLASAEVYLNLNTKETSRK